MEFIPSIHLAPSLIQRMEVKVMLLLLIQLYQIVVSFLPTLHQQLVLTKLLQNLTLIQLKQVRLLNYNNHHLTSAQSQTPQMCRTFAKTNDAKVPPICFASYAGVMQYKNEQ